jgi:hypothetical protein
MFPGLHRCEVEGCGGTAERHHVDGNTGNNDRSNIAFLCNKHHKEADGRMSRPEFRLAAIANRVGVPLAPEHRAKISASLVGRPCPENTRVKIGAANTAAAARRRPAHCPRGHAYDAANTRISKAGAMNCRACERARSLAAYYRRKASA